jgi:hypothetical protein
MVTESRMNPQKVSTRAPSLKELLTAGARRCSSASSRSGRLPRRRLAARRDGVMKVRSIQE